MVMSFVVAVTAMVPVPVAVRSPDAECVTPVPPVSRMFPVVEVMAALTVSRPVFAEIVAVPFAETVSFRVAELVAVIVTPPVSAVTASVEMSAAESMTVWPRRSEPSAAVRLPEPLASESAVIEIVPPPRPSESARSVTAAIVIVLVATRSMSPVAVIPELMVMSTGSRSTFRPAIAVADIPAEAPSTILPAAFTLIALAPDALLAETVTTALNVTLVAELRMSTLVTVRA